MSRNEAIKHLQNLYSWCEFYAKGQQWEAYNKCQLQIEDHKNKYNLNQ
jgi:hypothetical protein